MDYRLVLIVMFFLSFFSLLIFGIIPRLWEKLCVASPEEVEKHRFCSNAELKQKIKENENESYRIRNSAFERRWMTKREEKRLWEIANLRWELSWLRRRRFFEKHFPLLYSKKYSV